MTAGPPSLTSAAKACVGRAATPSPDFRTRIATHTKDVWFAQVSKVEVTLLDALNALRNRNANLMLRARATASFAFLGILHHSLTRIMHASCLHRLHQRGNCGPLILLSEFDGKSLRLVAEPFFRPETCSCTALKAPRIWRGKQELRSTSESEVDLSSASNFPHLGGGKQSEQKLCIEAPSHTVSRQCDGCLLGRHRAWTCVRQARYRWTRSRRLLLSSDPSFATSVGKVTRLDDALRKKQTSSNEPFHNALFLKEEDLHTSLHTNAQHPPL